MKNWKHLPTYNINDYAPMFTTVDIALFSIMDDELGVMLIKRKEEPYQGYWALPGGFIEALTDDTALMAAKRELEEETGLSNIYLEELCSFTRKERDPRELVATRLCRIFSIAHFALIDHEKVNAIAGSDAEAFQWCKLSKLPELAFDHKEIINKAVNRIRNKINYTNVGFELIPTNFTIPELRDVFEKILGRKLNPTNFRTKLLKLKILDPLGSKRVVGRGQPAPLYKLNRKKLEKLSDGESLFY